MTIVGIVAFFVLWAYAIGTFGIFLGLGAGWIPAAFFAFLIDFAFVALLGVVAVFLSRGDRVVTVSRRFVMPRPSSDQLATLWEVIRGVGILVAGGLALLGVFFVFQGEIDGSCAQDLAVESEYATALEWFTSRAATEQHILDATDIELQLEFGSRATSRREALVDARRDAKLYGASEAPGFCPLSGA